MAATSSESTPCFQIPRSNPNSVIRAGFSKNDASIYLCCREGRLIHADTSRLDLLLVSLTRPFAYYESLSHPDSMRGVFKNLAVAVAVAVHGEGHVRLGSGKSLQTCCNDGVLDNVSSLALHSAPAFPGLLC
jgi:hypothetical protein